MRGIVDLTFSSACGSRGASSRFLEQLGAFQLARPRRFESSSRCYQKAEPAKPTEYRQDQGIGGAYTEVSVYHRELSQMYRTNEFPDYTKKGNLSMRFFDSQRSQPSRLNHNPTTNKKISNLHINHSAKKSTPLSSTPHNKPYWNLSIPQISHQKENPLPHLQPDHLSPHLPSLLNYHASHLGWHRRSMPLQLVYMTSNYTAPLQIPFHPEYYASVHSD